MHPAFQKVFGGYKGLLFALGVAIGLGMHLYTQQIVGQLRDDSRSLVQFYAQIYSKVTEEDFTDDLSFIFENIIQKTTFPLIQTDAELNPVTWKGLSIDSRDHSDEALLKVSNYIQRMDREIEPVPIKYQDKVLGYLYFGDSKLIMQLRWLPYIQISLIVFFIALGLVGYANIKRSEQRHIWVGMAKETAHQLGTPLSSLMGWLEWLRSGKIIKKEEIYSEIEKDLKRLQIVTKRFSQIGSKPDLVTVNIEEILKEAVAYIRRRTPQLGRQVKITELYQQVPPVAINSGLFQWAVENVMKNGLDAIDKKEGLMEVKLGLKENRKLIYIEVADNGKGIEGSKKKIFKPGFSTKKRGWGLGLTLAKRIIEDYHRGKLFVKDSRPGIGTVIRIELYPA